MQISKIKLENFRQHVAREIGLAGNLIGIVGPNGTGKSNFLGGIQYGLVGDLPDVTKDRLLTWGAKKGYVELTLADGTIIRRSVSSNAAELIQGGKTTSGTVQVNNTLKAQYDLDKELAKQSLFVRQADIDSVLFETPAKREQAFQKLCGMGSAATIYKKAGDIILNKVRNPPDYDAQILLTSQTLQDNKARLETLQKEQEDSKLGITADELKELKESLNDYTQLLGTITSAIGLSSQHDHLSKTIADTADRIAALTAGTSNITEEDLDTLENNISTAKQLAGDIKRYQEAKSLYDLRKKEVDKLEKIDITPEEVDELSNIYKKLQEDYHKAQGTYTMLNEIYTAIFKHGGGISQCPICESEIKEPGKIKANLEAKIAKASKSDDGAAVKAEIAAKTSKLAAYNKQLAESNARLSNAQSALETIKPLDIDLFVLEKEITSMSATLKLNRNTQITLRELATVIAVNNKSLEKYDEQLSSLIGDIKANKYITSDGSNLPGLKQEIEAMKSKTVTVIEAAHRRAEENSRRAGVLAELSKSVEALTKTLVQLEEKREAGKNISVITKTLTNVRDWFHYSNGPRTLSASIIKDMSANINDFLTKLEAPFAVVPLTEEGLSFGCVFHDGRASSLSAMPGAEELSGGEKILLATCFRLAGYCMFANKLGLLSLDEPTVYLDDNNVARFCTFLEKIKEVASVLGLQLFIATHERSVIPYMDTVIDLQ